MEQKSNLIIYQTEDGRTKIETRLEDETVWLTQGQLCELFQKSKATISEHIKHIFDEGELEEEVVVRNYRTTTQHGAIEGKTQERDVKIYNLDVIISVGYRVKSLQGTKFRQWATARLREYIVKGFTMNDELLKQAGGGNYFDELLSRIRDIRSSEKVFWRKVLDIYATSIDYDPKTEVSQLFFKTVQNKMHWAAHGNTAAEVIFNRIDANKPHLGLTSFKGLRPTKYKSKIMNLKPIKTEQDYNKALERLELIFDAELGTKAGDELEILGILIEEYENKHFPIGLPDPVEAIKFRMEQLNYSQKDLAEVIGLKSRANEILNRKRKLSLGMIRKLNEVLHIPSDVLIQAY